MQAPRRPAGGLPRRAPAQPAVGAPPHHGRRGRPPLPPLRPVVAAAAAALALGGCSLLDGFTERSAPTTTAVPVEAERPVVGQCWALAPGAGRHDDRRAATALPSCDEPHAAETWRVENLPARWAEAPRPPVPGSAEWAAFDRDRRDACAGVHLDTFLARPPAEQTPMGERRPPEILTGTSAAPTDEQWGRGARWVRCDVGLPFPGETGFLRYSVGGMYGAGGGGGRVPAANLPPLCVGSLYEPLPCDQPHDMELVARYAGGKAGEARDFQEKKAWFDRCEADIRAYRYGSRPLDADPRLRQYPDGGRGTGPEMLCFASWPAGDESAPPASVGSVRDGDWRRA